MKAPLVAVAAILCNVGAQIAMKFAGQITVQAKHWQEWFSPWLLLALALYGISFLLTIRVFASNPLSVASPAMAGGAFLLVSVAGWLLFAEDMTPQRMAGIGLIFAGIVLLTRSQGT